jgi:iron(III) transport system permease protein
MKPSILMQRFLLLAFLLLVFGPLAALIVDLVRALAAGHADWLWLMLPLGRRMGLFFRSLGLSLSVAGAGMLCGFFSALYLWRLRSGFGSYLRWFVLLWIIVSPYIHALTWMTLINACNLFLNNFGLAGIPFQGWLAAWWIQVMALAPVSIGLTLIGFESIDPVLIESSRMLREDIRTLYKIMLPLAKPLILAGGGFVFLLSFVDYGVPSLFHLNVYPLEIFAEYSASHEPARALLSSVPLLLVTVLILGASQAPLRQAMLKPPAPMRPRMEPLVFPAWVKGAQGLAVVLLIGQVLVPILVLALTAGTWEQILGSVGAARQEIFFTFGVAAITALLGLALGFSAAHALIKPGKYTKAWWLLVIAPLAVPAPLVGIGLIALWNRPIVGAVYGTALMPVFAWLARFTPLAALVFAAQLRRLDPLLIDAARLFHTSRSKTWWRIYLPMLAPGLLAAGFIVFALCAGELGAGLIVAPPGQATLIMRIYNYLHYGASETVAGLCLFMTLTAGGLAGLTGLMLSKK